MEVEQAKKSRVVERRRSDAAADAPVSKLLLTLKSDVRAAKLRDKMYEIDLINIIASDDIV